MNKKGDSDGGGIWLFFIFLALIPMCSHAGETEYSQYIDDCVEFNFEEYYNSSSEYYPAGYLMNETDFSKSEAKEWCHKRYELIGDVVQDE